jgi:uncharacterized DUF497 family protein
LLNTTRYYAVRIQWCGEKGLANSSSTEAMTVFEDPLASTLPDDQHSLDEDRFITVGNVLQAPSSVRRYTETTSGIRLIGARPATAAEVEQYEES